MQISDTENTPFYTSTQSKNKWLPNSCTQHHNIYRFQDISNILFFPTPPLPLKLFNAQQNSKYKSPYSLQRQCFRKISKISLPTSIGISYTIEFQIN